LTEPNPRTRTRELRDLAALFFRLGVTAFGGPAAHIAMMQDEVVRRRAWMSADRFLDLIGAANLIPGPTSTELAIHIGLARAGWRGLVVAGTCFIVPACAITALLGWVYIRYGALPQTEALFYGIKPVIIAIVVQALWMLAPQALKDRRLLGVGGTAFVACALGMNEIVVLVLGGLAALALQRGTTIGRLALGPIGLASAGHSLAVATSAPPSLASLFLVFAKIGSVLFGSGYVLLAFLRADLVEGRHWLTEAQLLDAVAVGQLTPGPVFTTATFIGYVLAGAPGATVATLGIFLPAFVFVAVSAPLVPRMRSSPTLSAFLDGVNVASLALMALVTVQLARVALVDVWTLALAAFAALLLVRYRFNSAWLVLLGAAVGGALHGLRTP
jgi:chromate transporter